MSIHSQTMSSSVESDGTKVIRVLALHGSEGTAEEFPSRLASLALTLATEHNSEIEITAVEGPFPKGEGYSWWTMPPGVRSFTANEYGGFDTAASKVLEAWNGERFDLCVGHSQGAIMLASLMALNRVPYHPRRGYVFNGVSFPNPFRQEMKNLKARLPSSSNVARVLFVIGTNDKVTPNETGEELRNKFRDAGVVVDTIQHPGGHAIPNGQPKVIRAIGDWIANTEFP
jgi:predicted esterase